MRAESSYSLQPSPSSAGGGVNRRCIKLFLTGTTSASLATTWCTGICSTFAAHHSTSLLKHPNATFHISSGYRASISQIVSTQRMPKQEAWSDSDEDDLPQIETSVLLGIPDGVIESPSDLKDAAVSRIGGLPVRRIPTQTCISRLFNTYDLPLAGSAFTPSSIRLEPLSAL